MARLCSRSLVISLTFAMSGDPLEQRNTTFGGLRKPCFLLKRDVSVSRQPSVPAEYGTDKDDDGQRQQLIVSLQWLPRYASDQLLTQHLQPLALVDPAIFEPLRERLITVWQVFDRKAINVHEEPPLLAQVWEHKRLGERWRLLEYAAVLVTIRDGEIVHGFDVRRLA